MHFFIAYLKALGLLVGFGVIAVLIVFTMICGVAHIEDKYGDGVGAAVVVGGILLILAFPIAQSLSR